MQMNLVMNSKLHMAQVQKITCWVSEDFYLLQTADFGKYNLNCLYHQDPTLSQYVCHCFFAQVISVGHLI